MSFNLTAKMMKCPLTCMTMNPRMLYTHWGFIWLIFVASKVGHSSPPFILLIWEYMTWLWILLLKSFGSRHVFLSQETKIKRQKGDDKTLDFAFIFFIFFYQVLNTWRSHWGPTMKIPNSQANKQFKPFLFAFEAFFFFFTFLFELLTRTHLLRSS